MRIETDKRSFDRMQTALLEEMIRAIRGVLESKSLPKARVRDITEDVAFHLCALLDGSAEVEFEGAAIAPHLTFRRSPRGALVTSSSGSEMHERVFGCVDEVFAASAPEESAPPAPGTKGVAKRLRKR
jgi:hypothetical protein